jgi:phasin family protein
MITETISALTGLKGMLEPVQRLNQETVETVQRLAAHQIDSLKTYSDLGTSQLQMAAEVRDMQSLQKLMSKQTDALLALSQCLMSDIRAVIAIGADFVSHAEKIGLGAAPVLPVKAPG